MITVAIDMLNCVEDSQSSVSIIHDANDGEMDLDFSPIEYNESEEQNMIVLVVNKPGSGETFTEDRLFDNWSINPDWKFKFTRHGRVQGSTFVSIKSAQKRQLTQARLKTFLDFVQSFQYVVIYKVNRLDEVNKFLPLSCLCLSVATRGSLFRQIGSMSGFMHLLSTFTTPETLMLHHWQQPIMLESSTCITCYQL